MMSGKSTGREWSMLGDRVFVYLKDEGTGLAFLRQAEAEGFSFGDGATAEELIRVDFAEFLQGAEEYFY